MNDLLTTLFLKIHICRRKLPRSAPLSRSMSGRSGNTSRWRTGWPRSWGKNCMTHLKKSCPIPWPRRSTPIISSAWVCVKKFWIPCGQPSEFHQISFVFLMMTLINWSFASPLWGRGPRRGLSTQKCPLSLPLLDSSPQRGSLREVISNL